MFNVSNTRFNRHLILCSIFLMLPFVSVPAAGQQSPSKASESDDIIVNARRDQNDPISVVLRRNRDEIRLKRVAYRLGVANVDSCEKPRMMTGMVVHDLSYYNSKVRKHFAELYEMTYGFAVLAVVPNSAASAAGLKMGDQIISVNGESLVGFKTDLLRLSGYFGRSGGFEFLLADKLTKGAVVLTVKRDDDILRVSMVGKLGCGSEVRLETAEDPTNEDFGKNAWYDNVSVGITPLLVEFAESDDELAFIVGHELAHNFSGDYFKHAKHKIEMNAKDSRAAEIAADKYAVGMMYRAQYNPAAASNFIFKIQDIKWLSQSNISNNMDRLNIIQYNIDKIGPPEVLAIRKTF